MSGVIPKVETLSELTMLLAEAAEMVWRTSWQNGQERPSSDGAPCAGPPAIVGAECRLIERAR